MRSKARLNRLERLANPASDRPLLLVLMRKLDGVLYLTSSREITGDIDRLEAGREVFCVDLIANRAQKIHLAMALDIYEGEGDRICVPAGEETDESK